MTPEVEKAVDAIRAQFGRDLVLVGADREGGTYVIVEAILLGAPFAQADSWVGFHIPSTCPYADVYPHFVRADVSRLDGKPLGEGFSAGYTFPDPSALKIPGELPSRAGVQVSRRSNRKDAFGLESPLLKLLKVMQWIKSH